MQIFDYIWIGTGQATGTVVPKLAASGLKIAVIERGRFGGSCVNYGCTPTKALVAAARAAHMVRRSGDFGINVSGFNIDFPAVMDRMNLIRNGASNGLENWLDGMKNVTLFRGAAEFISADSIQVGTDVLVGKNIVIHTGTTARKPPIPGIDLVPWMDSAGLLELKELPEHMIVIGGSYIGLEFSQIFRRLGSRVTILERSSRIMSREDADLSTVTKDVLTREGIRIIEDARIEGLEKTDEGIRVRLGNDQDLIEGSHLLVGAGRIPASADLKLEKAGVVTDDRGFITVDDSLRSSIPNTYALGDINSRGAFTHTSVNDGEIFLDNLFGDGDRKVSDRIPVYSMFTDPPLGRIGIDETQARKSERKLKMATMPMAAVSRAKEKGETDGLIKIIVDAESEEILGASILGVGGDEIISMFAAPMYTGMSYHEFRKTVLPHPTVAELIPWVLDGLKDID